MLQPCELLIMNHVGLYRKVVSYVLLRSGLGSPTEIAVVREATGTDKSYGIMFHKGGSGTQTSILEHCVFILYHLSIDPLQLTSQHV